MVIWDSEVVGSDRQKRRLFQSGWSHVLYADNKCVRCETETEHSVPHVVNL